RHSDPLLGSEDRNRRHEPAALSWRVRARDDAERGHDRAPALASRADARRHDDHGRRRPRSDLPRALPEARQLSNLAAVPAQQRVVDAAVYCSSVALGRDGDTAVIDTAGLAAIAAPVLLS